MRKRFMLKPLFNLNEDMPNLLSVEIPVGSKVDCKQYANHVFLVIHHSTAFEVPLCTRQVALRMEGDAVPGDWEWIGSVIANESGLGAEEDEELVEIPLDTESFFNMLAFFNVYLSPERVKIGDSKSWSFIKE